MLIVAMPKSASSSLLDTIVRVHALNDISTVFRRNTLHDLPAAASYPALDRQHAEFKELTADAAERLTRNGDIAKHHIPPTENNQQLLHEMRKIVLLRDPEDIILAYKRGDDSGVHLQKSSDFFACATNSDWLRRAKQIGLLRELERFRDEWLNHDGDKLLISYLDLINKPQATINRVEQYLGLPPSDDTILERTRYTGSTQFRSPGTWRLLSRPRNNPLRRLESLLPQPARMAILRWGAFGALRRGFRHP